MALEAFPAAHPVGPTPDTALAAAYPQHVMWRCTRVDTGPTRLKRYISAGGNKKIFTIFEKRQTKPSKKIKISDHVIYNNKKIKNLEKKVRFLMRRYE